MIVQKIDGPPNYHSVCFTFFVSINMKVLFIIPYPEGEAPSQRFRFEQYLDDLNQHGIQYSIEPFMRKRTWEILYLKGRFFRKGLGILSGYWRRWKLVLTAGRYDAVFIHREFKPFGLPIAEWFLCKIFAKNVVFDFDDAIWLKNFSESNRTFTFIKRYSNVKNLCKWANTVSVGNTFLAEFAKTFNSNVVINPTTIDTDNYHNLTAQHSEKIVTIGWTGSHSTIRYLNIIEPVLQKIEKQYAVVFKIISDLPPKLALKNIQFVQWSKKTEIEDLLTLDIGLMPLENNDWSKGKCGFKALQYMSLGIPAIVSPVGVNTDIVDDGINGFLCHDLAEWETKLITLIENAEQRRNMGKSARLKVESAYSVNSNRSNFIHLFTSLKKEDEKNSVNAQA